MDAPYITYTRERLKPASFLMKRVSAKNASAMRGKTIGEQREARERLADVRIVMPAVSAEEIECAGIPCQWIYHREHSGKVILYLHGGSWAFGSLRTAKSFGGFLAGQTRCKVLVAGYRLSPEHPYPTGLDDCFAVYQWLIACGYAPEDIAIFGDSAGGNLGLCLMHRLKMLGHPLPACFGGASPVTDARRESAIASSSSDLIYLPYDGKETDIFTLYTGNTSERGIPEISPICGDLSGFPPILIHTGEDEPLVKDNIAFAEKAYAQGVDVSLKIFGGMFHDFTVVGISLRESRQSVAEFARFFGKHLSL